MLTLCRENRKYIKSGLLDNINNINHAFTTANGGKSHGKIEGFNLGFNCGDDPSSVLANYKLAANDLDLPFDKITASKQTHSDCIRRIYDRDAGIGVSRPQDTTDVDGLMTDRRGVPLVVFAADCVPVILADIHGRAVAAVHSGWRGTVSEIASKAVRLMCDTYGIAARDIRAAIGPSIGGCCFETDRDVAFKFKEKYRRPDANGKFTVDLQSAVRDMLIESGVPNDGIDILRICTVCGDENLFSYRRQGKSAGRMGAFIMLKPL